jgi:hypothetical protein
MNRIPTRLAIVISSTFLLMGCDDATRHLVSAPKPTKPGAEAIVATSKTGNKATAMRLFLEADWASEQLFSDGSPANLSESQFAAHVNELIEEGNGDELYAITKELQSVAAAIKKAGRDAITKGEFDMARKYFVALQQCGDALDSSDRSTLFQLLGGTIKAAGEAELKKISVDTDKAEQDAVDVAAPAVDSNP